MSAAPHLATERLYFDAAKTKLVREGDPEAAFLAVAVGHELPEGFKAPSGTKAVSKPEDKQAEPAANKSGVTVKKG